MKKLNYLLLAVFIILISCGGKNSGKNNGQESEFDESDSCLIFELEGMDTIDAGGVKNIMKKGTKELYSGIAIEKDQNDSIIKQLEIKNGWVIHNIEKEKIKDEYFTVFNKKYENGVPVSGYSIQIEETIGLKHVMFYSDVTDSDKNYQIVAYDGDSRSIEYYGKQFPKCWKGSGSSLYRLSEEEFYHLLDELKKELPRFNYWKEDKTN